MWELFETQCRYLLLLLAARYLHVETYFKFKLLMCVDWMHRYSYPNHRLPEHVTQTRRRNSVIRVRDVSVYFISPSIR